MIAKIFCFLFHRFMLMEDSNHCFYCIPNCQICDLHVWECNCEDNCIKCEEKLSNCFCGVGR
jgi:hypothetical protein